MNKGYRIKGFDRRLKRAIADSNLTLTDICRKSGVSRSNLWAYCQGGNPSIYSLKRLAVTLNVTSDYLLGIGGE